MSKGSRGGFVFLLMIVLIFACCACGNEDISADDGQQSITMTTTTQSTTTVQTQPVHVHTYGETVVVPNCTEGGYTIFSCECGDSYYGEKKAALGHSIVVIEATVPTCTQNGMTEGSYCGVCDTIVVAQTEISATGHAWSDWVTVEETTEEAPGLRRRTCENCGAEEEESIDKLPAGHSHNYAETVVEPTCTQVGYTKYTCECGDYYIGNELAALGHSEVRDLGWDATCTEDGVSDGSHCEACGITLTAQELIPATGHTEVTDKGYAATCTTAGKTDGSHCSVCNAVLVAQKTISAAGHDVIILEATWPTEHSDGLTEGESCSNCGMVVTQQVVIPSYAVIYSNDYYYEQLGKEANGEALQELYKMLDMAAMTFHFDTAIDLTDNTVATFCYTDLGLSQEEACKVWMFYKQDHPLYYWISTRVVYSDDSIMLQTEPDHWQGQERAEDNALICGKVEQYLAVMEDETSSYIIALVFHNSIITAIDYAYDAEGYPQDALWAHRVLGVFDGRGAVCEGYAQAYQLLLNAAGVENIYVVGDAGVPGYGFNAHAWNLVQLDDGGWYWCDLTWDDTPRMEFGVAYRYFCVNDTQNVNWFDGGIISEAFSFCDSHEPAYTLGSWEWEVVLPDRAAEPYQAPEDAVVREIFTVGDFTYCVNGYNTVRLTAVNYNESGTLYLPETVTYNGRTYTVVEIGRMRNGLVEMGNVIPSEFTAVHLPKTLRFIWDGAIFGHSVEAYIVDPENPCFTAKDGVLYTTNYYTLVQYPCNAPYVDRYVIPDETIYIAKGSLRNIRNPFGELVIGKHVRQIGVANWGYGYYNGTQEGYYGRNEVSGELSDLHRMAYEAGRAVTISVDPKNTVFAVVDGIVYELDWDGNPGAIITVADSYVTEIVLPDGLNAVDLDAFDWCMNLKSISIPAGVCISGFLDYSTPNLEQIIFRGTMEQWNNSFNGDYWKDSFWNYAPADLCVICTDGTLENPIQNND